MKLTRWDAIAAFAGLMLAASWLTWDKYVKEALPASDWFAVRNIAVPDFVERTDPAIVYDRISRKPHRSIRTVEVHSATEEKPTKAKCKGEAIEAYELPESMPETGVKMSWFMGWLAWKNCKSTLEPGQQYVTQTHWDIYAKGYPAKEYDATSNIFRVLPEGSQPYITLEQNQKLEEVPLISPP